MRSARQARYRCLLPWKGEKHHGVKSPLRDPFPDGYGPAHTKCFGRPWPKACQWPLGTFFYKRMAPLCVECACASSHRVRTGPGRALWRSRLRPSMRLNRRCRCSRWAFPTSHGVIAAGPGVRRVRGRPTVDLLYHDRIRKCKPPSRDTAIPQPATETSSGERRRREMRAVWTSGEF
jgi:hypothetical protein